MNEISYICDGMPYICAILGLWICFKSLKETKNIGFIFLGVLFIFFAIERTNTILYSKHILEIPTEIQQSGYTIKTNRPIDLPIYPTVLLIATFLLSKRKQKEIAL